MTDETRHKIFISWSGDLSKGVALALKQWLETVFESLDAWVSDADIVTGERSLRTIEENLHDAVGGLIVLTVENQYRPRVNFEAGPLSHQFNGQAKRVIPLLVDASDMRQLEPPLNMFQGQLLNQDGVKKVLESLYVMIGQDKGRAADRMAAYWTRLEDAIAAVRAEHEAQPKHADASLGGLQDQLTRMERMLLDLTPPPGVPPTGKDSIGIDIILLRAVRDGIISEEQRIKLSHAFQERRIPVVPTPPPIPYDPQ